MTYKTWKWISASAYAALLPLIDDRSEQHLTRPRGEADSQVLFLALTIGRDRRVVRHPSFHYPAPARQVPIPRSGFSLELADECRNRLVCWPLSTGLGPEYCWPKTFFAEVPYPPEAKWLLVWEGDHLLYEECIPSPAALDLACTETPDGVQLSWGAEPEEDLWYLVQWQDTDGTWRGLPPMARETHALVPGALFRQQASVRVLATSGIATAAATCTMALPPQPRAITIAVTELRRPGRGRFGSSVAGWRAFAYDEAGRSVRGARFRWFDSDGREIHAGATLPVNAVGNEMHRVTVVLRGRHGPEGPMRRMWHVRDRGRDRALVDPTISPNKAYGG